MSFKDLNLNKGFSRPKLKEKYKPKVENEEVKNDSTKHRKDSKVETNNKIEDPTRKLVKIPKDKILKHQKVQKIEINPKKRYKTQQKVSITEFYKDCLIV